MIKIESDTLFKAGYRIRYVIGWDDVFKQHKGILRFYNKTPLFVVNVDLNKESDKLSEEDIVITLGDHNAKDVEEVIKKKHNAIYEMCKLSPNPSFVLDLIAMKSVEIDDFDTYIPRYGLSTMFIFERNPATYHCLMNPAKNVKDGEFYAWLISYIYSNICCLAPRGKVNDYAKKFLQAVSLISTNSGNKNIKISTKPAILGCGLEDNGDFLPVIPGKTDRFEKLITSAMEQMANHNEKKGKTK